MFSFSSFSLPLPLVSILFISYLDESSDAKLDLGPQVGDVITFSYSGFSPEGTPTDVKIHHTRMDMPWQDVVASFYSDAPVQRQPDGTCGIMMGEGRRGEERGDDEEGRPAEVIGGCRP